MPAVTPTGGYFLKGGVTRRCTPMLRRPAPPWEKDKNALERLLVADPATEDFGGTCLDMGATRTLIGKGQAYAYARLAGLPATFAPTKGMSFFFGGAVTPSLGTIDIRLPFAAELDENLRMDLVVISVPLLLGLDFFHVLGEE